MIKVVYWRGTTQVEGHATTYRGAMRIAARNQNAHDPTFYDASGNQYWDDGNGIARPDSNGTSHHYLVLK